MVTQKCGYVRVMDLMTMLLVFSLCSSYKSLFRLCRGTVGDLFGPSVHPPDVPEPRWPRMDHEDGREREDELEDDEEVEESLRPERVPDRERREHPES